MNNRPENRESIEPTRHQKRIGKPISKLNLLLRGVATAAFALFGIALVLDADEMRLLVGAEKPAAPERLAEDIDATAKQATKTDQASQWQLEDNDEFQLPRVVTAEGMSDSDESMIVPVAGTQAEPKTLDKQPARSVLDFGKSEVWSLMPEPKSAVKTATKPTAAKPTVAKSSAAKPKAAAGVARIARPAKASPKRVVVKTDATGRARVVNRRPSQRPAVSNRGPLKAKAATAHTRPQTVAKKATVRQPLAKATPVSKSKNIEQPTVTTAKIEPTPDPAFSLQLDKASQKTVAVPSPKKTTPEQKPSKQPQRVTFKDRLARLYSPLTKKKPRQQTKTTTTFQRTKTVPPAEQTAQPKSVVAKTEKPKQKTNGIPVWALDGPTVDVKSKKQAIQVTATKPEVKQPPRQLSPPHAVRSTPDAVKTASKSTTRTATKPVQPKRGLGRFKLGGIVGKLFPSKKPQTVAKKQKATDAATKPQHSLVAKAKTVEQTSGSTSAKPTFTLTLDSRNSDLLSKSRKDSPAGGAAGYLSASGLDALIVDQAPVEAPVPLVKAPRLPLDAEVTQVAAADPVFDLVPLDQPNSPFRLPVMATRQAEKVEDAPPAPTGDEAKSDEDTLGYFGFKPIGELTVDIDAIKGEDPPNLAKPEFEKLEPVVLDTTWIDQTLTAQTFPFYHQPLYFEDPNAERCGDTWGLLQPAMSAAQFYLTIPVLPYLIGAYPPNEEVESLGDCPYGCKYKFTDAYVPRFSWKGVALQGAATTGMIYLIP